MTTFQSSPLFIMATNKVKVPAVLFYIFSVPVLVCRESCILIFITWILLSFYLDLLDLDKHHTEHGIVASGRVSNWAGKSGPVP